MKYTLTLVLIFFVKVHVAQTQLKILTYNIFHGEQAYKSSEPSLDDIARIINDTKPDLVALQEVDSATGRLEGIYKVRINWMQELAAKTGMFGFFGKAMDYSGGGYGEGLLSRKPTTATVTILPSPAGGEPRSLISVEYPLANNKKIIFAGTHLCHQFMPNKMAQIAKINEMLTTKDVPVILCGDLNFKPSEKPYDALAVYWQDAALIKGNPQHTFPSDHPDIRIDYIWLKKGTRWKVKDIQVLPYVFSDHKPVLVTVEL